LFGERRGGTVAEALHFFKCEHWGGYFDARDYGAVLDHEEPLPPSGMRSSAVASLDHQRCVIEFAPTTRPR
jgi:hypothetical protein